MNRVFLKVLGGLLLLVAIAGVGLKAYFTSDRLRAMLVPELSSALKREVSLQDVGLGFWGGLHASMSGLRVAERPGFGIEPFLWVGEARIFLSYGPLLAGHVAIDDILLISPKISVIILENGEANYADLAEPSQGDGSGKTAFSVSKVTVEDGGVFYDDQKGQTLISLEDMDYALESVRSGQDQAWNGELSIGRVGWQQGGRRDTLNTGLLKLTHQVSFNAAGWDLKSVRLNWAGLSLTATGSIKSSEEATHLSLRIEEPNLDLGKTKLREVVDLPVDVTGHLSVRMEIDGDLNLNVSPARYPEVAATVTLSGIGVTGKALPQETWIDTASVGLARGIVRLQTFKARALGGNLSATGEVAQVWPPSAANRLKVTFEAQTDRLEIPQTESPAKGQSSDYGELLANLRETDAEVSLKVGQLVMSDFSAQGVALGFQLQKGRLHIQNLESQIFGGSVAASGNLNLQTGNSQYPLGIALNAKGLQLTPMLPMAAGSEIGGRVDAAIRANGLLDAAFNPAFIAGKYALEGNVSLREGTFKSPDLLIPLDSLSADIGFEKGGSLQLNRFYARAGESDVSASGQVSRVLDYLLGLKGAGRPVADMAIRSRMLDLDAMIPVYVPAATGDQTSGVLVGIREADGRFDLAIGTMISDSTRFTNVKAIATAKNGVLSVKDFTANTMGGAVLVQVELDGHAKGLVPVRVSANLSHVQAEKFLQGTVGWAIPVFGELGAGIQLAGEMDSTLILVESTLRAEGEARVDDGRVVNWSWLQTTSGLVPHLKFLDFSDLPIKGLIAPFKISEGRVFLEQMGFQSGEVGFQLAGSAGMDGTLDMGVEADLPASKFKISGLGLDRIAGPNLQPDARVPLKIHIGGTSEDPKVEVNIIQEARKILNDKSQEVKDKVKDKTRGLLKSLF
jgi:uncharacterized protein involved in outer membrane biogenesis